MAGALMVVIIYVAMRYIPNYRFGPAPLSSPSPGTTTDAPPEVNPYASTVIVTGVDELLGTVLWISIIALAIVAVAGLIGCWFLARRLLSPIHRISAAAVKASKGNLSHRIADSGPADELTELSRTFNMMLAKLQTSFDASERFAANASHELMTPLAANRTIIQVAQANPSEISHGELLTMLFESNERSIAISKSLMELSMVQQGPFNPVPVGISSLLVSGIRTWRAAPFAGELNWRIAVEPGRAVEGQPILLEQLIDNLLGNAVKYNKAGGLIEVTAHATPSIMTVNISNTGDTIGEEAAARLLEPFYRAAQRTAERDGPKGHGLGLSIVSAIIDRHGGTLTLTPRPAGGLSAEFTLPVHGP